MTSPADGAAAPANRSILVTDSGLGGLSVFNAIANQLAQGSPWPKVKLTYFNAWPAPHRGYNHFKTREKRARIFDNALNTMAGYTPDLILIACNTLSIIYPHTPFATSSQICVEGIVDHGVQMLHEKLVSDPDGVAVILGTPTTIAAESHKAGLVHRGIAKERIIPIGCTNLAGWIEREPFSKTVTRMINENIQITAAQLGSHSGHVYAALCCTHFGYRLPLFEAAFSEWVKNKVTILNPNIRMAQQAFSASTQTKTYATEIDMQIVSKAEWSQAQVDAYLKLLPSISAATRSALQNYQLDQQLFAVD